MNRLVKKWLYGVGFLIFWSVVIGGPVWLWGQRTEKAAENPIATPEAYADLVVEEVYSINHTDKVDAAVRIKNPNAEVGVARFIAEFVFVDAAGQEVGRELVPAYILPGAVQHVAALNVAVSGPVSSVTVTLPEDLEWQVPAATTPETRFSTFLTTRSQEVVAGSLLEVQSGVVTSNSSITWQEVDVVVLGFSGSGQVSGIGTTKVGNLTSGERRDFSAAWPLPSQATTEALVFSSANSFTQGVLAPADTDPTQLR